MKNERINDSTSIWGPYAFYLPIAALLLFNLVYFHSISDDAYISFRYLDNWLNGAGLVFSPGERVEGYTNFLWILALAPLRWLGLPPEQASVILSLSALGLLFWAVYNTAAALSGKASGGWIALLLTAGSVHLGHWAVSGMETVFFTALLCLGNALLAKARRHTPGSSLSYGLAVLARPNGAAHAAIAFAVALLASIRDKRALQSLLLMALLFCLLPLVHLLFRLGYYGLPFPNTFYAKLGGVKSNLVSAGADYVLGFMRAGGFVLLLTGLMVLWKRRNLSWVVVVLLLQVIFQLLYVIYVGGDYFPFHRFLVPIIPMLAILAAVAINSMVKKPIQGYLVALLLICVQAVSAYSSYDMRAFNEIVQTRDERELVADWLRQKLPAETLLAVNAAGIIPYRTMFPTIDMLGLNDRHIAQIPYQPGPDGAAFTGHLKHDGAYVCKRAPDVVLTGGARLQTGRSGDEAILQSTFNTFVGDREFLRHCGAQYQAIAERLAPGKYAVAYLKRSKSATVREPAKRPENAGEWFKRGLEKMRTARFAEAIDAFRNAHELEPGNPAILANLGFALLDMKQYQAAIDHFKQAVEIDSRQYDAVYGLALAHQKLGLNTQAIALWRQYIQQAPDSAWTERARRNLNLLMSSK